MAKRKSIEDIDWEVDKYRCEFEPENHWNLRKKFMETHKQKYSEDRLVSLAQLFINIECLGCRYPEKSMELIDELSREVAYDFREEQKGKLQRTMVGASDVAEARAKGGYNPRRNFIGLNHIQFVTAQPTETGYSNEGNHCDKPAVVHNEQDLIANVPTIQMCSNDFICQEVNNIKNYNIDQSGQDSVIDKVKNYVIAGFENTNINPNKMCTNLNNYQKALKFFNENMDDTAKLHAITQNMKLICKFDFEMLNSSNMAWRCICSVDDIILNAEGSTKKTAKSNVVPKVLKMLKNRILSKLETYSTESKNDVNKIVPKKEIDFNNSSINKTIPVHKTNNGTSNRASNLIQKEVKSNQINQNPKLKTFYRALKMYDDIAVESTRLHTVTQCLKMLYKFEFKNSDNRMSCTCSVGDTIVHGEGDTKKIAKSKAIEKALNEIKKIIMNKIQSYSSDEAKQISKCDIKKKTSNTVPNLKSGQGNIKTPQKYAKLNHPLVLIFRKNNSNYCSMLFEAVSYTKQVLDFESRKTKEGKTEISVYIDQKLISEGTGDCAKSAKEEACQKAFQHLQKTCYTLEVKHTYISNKVLDASIVLKGSVDKNEIKDENIGNKLLRMMGWQGGGLGRQEQGIAAPIDVKHQSKRLGFGNATESDDFVSKIEATFQNFIQSDDDNDLVFSNGFTKEQREQMHKMAQKFGLKSHSYGTGANRHLVVSIKKKPWDIVQEIMRGKKNSKYNIIYPQNT